MSKIENNPVKSVSLFINFNDIPASVQAIMAEPLKQALLTGGTKEPEEMALIIKRAFTKLMR